MNLQEFNQAFAYRYDKMDTWRILSLDAPEGDCDDYAVTVLYIHTGQSVLRMFKALIDGDAVFRYVLDRKGERHIELWIKDRGWIDSQNMSFSATPRHTKIQTAFLPIIVIKLLLGALFG